MEQTLDQLDRLGYTLLEGALSPDEVVRLVAAVDRVSAERGPDRGDVHECSFLGHDDGFLELLDRPAVLQVVLAALGGNIYVYHCHLDVHPPASEPVLPRWRWHQDGGRQNVDLPTPRPRLSLKVAYFLTDVETAAHGPLWVLPESHRRDRLERPADGSTVPPGARPILVRAGTAVIFDRRLWHARGDNTSSVTRKALFYAYTYRWIRLRDDLTLSQPQIDRLSPVQRQLVGEGDGAIGYWFPTVADVPLLAGPCP